jgi:hypothetical protein
MLSSVRRWLPAGSKCTSVTWVAVVGRGTGPPPVSVSWPTVTQRCDDETRKPRMVPAASRMNWPSKLSSPRPIGSHRPVMLYAIAATGSFGAVYADGTKLMLKSEEISVLDRPRSSMIDTRRMLKPS